MWLPVADTAEALAGGNEREILAVIVLALAGVIVWLALYVRSLMKEHKDELLKRDDEWSKKLQAAQAELSREREERRKEILSTLTDVLTTNAAQQRSIDRCSEEIGRLSDLMQKWQEDI